MATWPDDAPWNAAKERATKLKQLEQAGDLAGAIDGYRMWAREALPEGPWGSLAYAATAAIRLLRAADREAEAAELVKPVSGFVRRVGAPLPEFLLPEDLAGQWYQFALALRRGGRADLARGSFAVAMFCGDQGQAVAALASMLMDGGEKKAARLLLQDAMGWDRVCYSPFSAEIQAAVDRQDAGLEPREADDADWWSKLTEAAAAGPQVAMSELMGGTGADDQGDGTGVEPAPTVGAPPGLVPDVGGLTEPEARAALFLEGLTEIITITVVSELALGQVVGTRPSAGAHLDATNPIELLVSGQLVEVPDIEGLTENAARKQLEALGFTLIVAEERVPALEPDKVASQQPPAGATLGTGNPVEVCLTEDSRIELLDLTGYDLDEARMRLDIMGLEPGQVTGQTRPEARTGTIIASDPPPGSKLVRGSTVDLVVASDTDP